MVAKLDIKPLKKVLTSASCNPTITRPPRMPFDSLSLTNTTILVKATSKADIEEFVRLFVSSFLKQGKKGLKNPDSIKNKIELRIGKYIGTKIHNLVAKMSSVEVIKDESGKIIDGFSFGLHGNKMAIGQMVLDSSKRGTTEGMVLLSQMAKRIKDIATCNNIQLITCDVDKNKKSLVRLYKKAGFVENTDVRTPKLYRLEVTPEEFCKNYLK